MPTHWNRPLSLFALAALLLSCGDSAQPGGPTGPEPIDVETPDGEICEILSDAHCLLPFPSDALTVVDPETDTGRRVNFAREAMPANNAGVRIDPTDWNRNDGFSPGPQISILIPGIDLEASQLPPVTDIGRSLDEDSGLILLDPRTGDRILAWAELDARSEASGRHLRLIHPARVLPEGGRIIVALRRLVVTEGLPIESSAVFAAFRDRTPTTNPLIEERRPAMDRIFADLEEHGVERDELHLAWDFTVASKRALSERLLHMRDDAFAELEDGAPAFRVDEVQESGGARRVFGTFEVPRYLTGEGEPGSVLDLSADGLPRRNGTQTANFTCVVPLGFDEAPRGFLYGHGLMGSAGEVLGLGSVGASINISFCATDWIGMSSNDIPNAIAVLQDLSRFGTLPDRLQQAHLNFLYLGRLMAHPAGFASHDAFGGEGAAYPVSGVFFLGASQGGITGGATMAVAQEFTRGVMAVGACRYSLLIPRSTGFDSFAPFFADGYEDPVIQSLNLGLAQMLWDRGEGQGYVQHLTSNPYPDTPPKDILYFEAFGDHQVANVATEACARSANALLREPALASGRSTDRVPFFGLDAAPALPYSGPALVVWDFGGPPPPTENTPPREGEDPHGKAGAVPAALLLVSEYLKTDGALVEVCDGNPCQSIED